MPDVHTVVCVKVVPKPEEIRADSESKTLLREEARSDRRASREDPGYVEATYWVGKMYYFMNRYEHAREAFEGFVYQDKEHPRIGDALNEYLHTYEKANTPPEPPRIFERAEIANEFGAALEQLPTSVGTGIENNPGFTVGIHG